MMDKFIKNKMVKDIFFEDSTMCIQFYFLKEKMDEYEGDKNLLFLPRNNNSQLAVPISIVDSQESFGIYEAAVPLKEYETIFNHRGTWDLFLTINSEEAESGDSKSFRLKSNFENHELLTFEYEEGNVFYPFTTNKGNLSLRSRRGKVRLFINDFSFTEETLGIEGYFLRPMSGLTILEKKLIVRNHETEEEKSLPIIDLDEKDLGNSLLVGKWKSNINLLNWMNVASHTYYKFYLEYTYMTDEGLPETKRTGRIKFKSNYQKMHKQIETRKVNGVKKAVLIKPTKKSKYLSVQVYNYKLIKELKRKIVNKVLRIKRGSAVKKMYQTAFKWVGLLPAKKNLIMFESFLGKQYSDNPRAIYEYLKENNPEYEMLWSVDKKFIRNFEGKDVPYVRRFSVKWLFKMARAKYWVSNSRLPLWIPKPSHTTYLQTWHGTPLKRLASDMEEVHMPGTNTEKYKRNFFKESRNWDYLVSPNRYSSEIFARAFNFEKTMIESGYPRNDVLYTENNPEKITAMKKRFGLPADKKVILYAPTWRDDQFYSVGKYKFDLELNLDQLKEELGEEYVIVLRMHYLVAENLDLSSHTGFAFDFSNHEDIRELYLVSDLLITDYSSVFFDYANLRRPMIFYVYDIETYRDKLRGFYFDFEKKAPGPLTKTTEEVIRYIKEIDNGKALPPEFEEFYNKFCYLESGESSKKVVETVFH
ncbi:CDP-glycerol glycerophosphotransferase family protein [Bacillus massiliglaciei]|uniref:CDP-glycerol glycerophosphotransferase family protein n=1 Tax=Bacillus massiliglaciei TaxID=1816693 RepID=UPI000B3317F9|nr:CDP-glycerol glycerophosphotransferase family protein [Bacillus massiliglaciei]